MAYRYKSQVMLFLGCNMFVSKCLQNKELVMFWFFVSSGFLILLISKYLTKKNRANLFIRPALSKSSV